MSLLIISIGVVAILVTLSLAYLAEIEIGFNKPDLRDKWVIILVVGYIIVLIVERVFINILGIEIDKEMIDITSQMGFAGLILTLVIFFPIAEEMFFRGLLFGLFEKRSWHFLGVLVPSLLWTLLHIQYEVVFSIFIFISGVLLSLLRKISNSIYPGYVLHVFGNLIAAFQLSN